MKRRDQSVTRLMCRLAGILALALGNVPTAQAEVIKDFQPILYDTATPDRLYLVGPITDARAPVRLNQALARYPDADTLVLASGGGHVYLALPMAYTVRSAGLKTHIAEGQACESACAYLFFAGTERSADGPLGVHQLSVADNSLGTEQVALANIVTAYEAFGVPNVVLSRMLATPPEGMYRFSPGEMTRLGMLEAATRTIPSERDAPVSQHTVWVPAFFPELARNEAPMTLYEACSSKSSNTSCNVLWGLVSGAEGQILKAWWVGTNSNTPHMVQGSPLEQSEAIDFKPNGIVRDGNLTVLFDPRNAKVAGQEQRYGGVSPISFEDTDLWTAEQRAADHFGLFDISALPILKYSFRVRWERPHSGIRRGCNRRKT